MANQVIPEIGYSNILNANPSPPSGGSFDVMKFLSSLSGTSLIDSETGPTLGQTLWGGITESGATTDGLMQGIGGLGMDIFNVFSGLKQLSLAEDAYGLQEKMAKENLKLSKADLRERAESINARRRSQRGGAHQIYIPEAGMKKPAATDSGIAHFGSAPAPKSAPDNPAANDRPKLG